MNLGSQWLLSTLSGTSSVHCVRSLTLSPLTLDLCEIPLQAAHGVCLLVTLLIQAPALRIQLLDDPLHRSDVTRHLCSAAVVADRVPVRRN